MNFLAKLKSFLKMLTPISERELNEQYLAQATCIADLERRMKKIYGHGL